MHHFIFLCSIIYQRILRTADRIKCEFFLNISEKSRGKKIEIFLQKGFQPTAIHTVSRLRQQHTRIAEVSTYEQMTSKRLVPFPGEVPATAPSEIKSEPKCHREVDEIQLSRGRPAGRSQILVWTKSITMGIIWEQRLKVCQNLVGTVSRVPIRSDAFALGGSAVAAA